MNQPHKKLREQGLLSDKQFSLLEDISNNKVISVYYELRILLYLGILLFTGGVGYIAYENIGDLGHVALMLILFLAIVGSAYYLFLKSEPYSREESTVQHIYFDYIVLLNALLLVGLFTYVQVYFNLVEVLLQWSSIITSVVFFALAYRFDHKGVLSMAITALAAAFGLSVSPVNWSQGDVMTTYQLYVTSCIVGSGLLAVGGGLAHLSIKKHFKFTYQNFGLLLLYFGLLCLSFDSFQEETNAFITLIVSGAIAYYTWRKHLFLFFLYSSIVAYIVLTYLLFELVFSHGEGYVLGIYYVPISCIAYVVFLVKHKKHFSDDN